jgi:hypothetical protein
MLMETFMKVCGMMIWRMDLEFTHIRMVLSTKETGSKTSSMALVLSNGQMVHPIKVNMWTDRSTDQGSLLGRTEVLTTEHFTTTILKVTVFIIGAINEYTKVTGKTIKWKAKANLNGQMAESIMASTMMIRRKAKVFFTGQMVENTKVNG